MCHSIICALVITMHFLNSNKERRTWKTARKLNPENKQQQCCWHTHTKNSALHGLIWQPVKLQFTTPMTSITLLNWWLTTEHGIQLQYLSFKHIQFHQVFLSLSLSQYVYVSFRSISMHEIWFSGSRTFLPVCQREAIRYVYTARHQS